MASVTDPASGHFVPAAERVAAFDNDGTLACERPTVQGAFIMQRLAAKATIDPALASRQPWQAARDGETGWLDEALTRHYQGDDSDLRVLIGAVMSLFSDMSVEQFATMVSEFFESERHPTLDRPYTEVAYRPMLELLVHLEDNGFTNYIVSGGGRDFMRPVSQRIYGIPPERVVGSAPKMTFSAEAEPPQIVRQAGMDILDDGPAKPIYLWDRAGRRPILAAGNADGDIPLLQFAGLPGAAFLRLAIAHDDAVREYEYSAGSETIQELARSPGWTLVSMANDWNNIF